MTFSRCFKNIGGRRCDTPDQGYYVKSLDLVYEAEDAKCTGVSTFTIITVYVIAGDTVRRAD